MFFVFCSQDLEEREKLAEEFYKPESDKEEEENFTPPSNSPDPSTNEDRVLKVLINTREELEKNIEANTISDLKCASSNEEASNTEPDSGDIIGDSKETPSEKMDIDKAALEDSNAATEPMETESEDAPLVQKNDLVTHEESVSVVEQSCASVSTSTEDSVLDSQPNSEKTEIVPSTKPTVLTKLNLASELTDACLTPSDALKDNDIFLKPAAKAAVEEKNTPTEETIDSEDFHLFFEDSDDILRNSQSDNNKVTTPKDVTEIVKSPEKIKKNEETAKPGLDLQKLYNSTDILSSDEEEVLKPKEVLTGKAKMFANLKLSSGPVRLKGGPDEVIDLDDDVEPKSGVKNLMQKFMRQYTAGQRKTPVEKKGGFLNLIKSGEQIEDTPDHNVKPGQRMNLLKSELRDSIAKQRDEEFKRRQKEYQMYENETEGLLGDGRFTFYIKFECLQ